MARKPADVHGHAYGAALFRAATGEVFALTLTVVRHVVDPSDHGKAPHQPGIEGLQKFGSCIHVFYSRIEPQVLAVWLKNNGHAVADG
jgi:hypothetical protein